VAGILKPTAGTIDATTGAMTAAATVGTIDVMTTAKTAAMIVVTATATGIVTAAGRAGADHVPTQRAAG